MRAKGIFFPLFFGILAALALSGRPAVGEERAVFSTWEGLEADKCAAIWLIKRFIDQNAVIRFFPRGQIITEGIAFDVPEARFRRYHNLSTFESMLQHYKLDDPRLARLGGIIHDIEVNIWERKVFPETRIAEEAINNIISLAQDQEAIITESLAYFDTLYSSPDTLLRPLHR